MLLTALLVAALAAGCTGGSGRTSAAGAAPSLRQITALLAAHGRAVRDRDASAFAADLATGDRSRGFRGRQQAAFANLADVPLAGWTYTLGEQAGDRGAETAATRRYGSAAVIVRVSLGYRLRGIDSVPSRHDLWWTFIRQGGAVRIAGDRDLAATGAISWRGPWDFGALRAVRGARSLILAHPGPATAALRTVAAGVDAAIPAVTAVWGDGWARRVAVLVPGSAAELAADTGSSAVGTSGAPAGDGVAALAVTDASAGSDDGSSGAGGSGSDGSGGAGPDAGPPGQRLIVVPDAFDRLSNLGRRIVLTHEVTHLAAAGATSVGTPRWIVEGFAEYVANIGTGQSVPTAAAELRAAVRAGGAPSAVPADSELADPASSAAAYQGAWLACRLIADRAGRQGLVRFYRAAAGPAVTGDPVSTALRTVLRETPAAFTAQWRTYVTRQLRA